MLLPDNIHPEETVYYNGAKVLTALRKHGVRPLLDLYLDAKAEKEMSMPMFTLCLDWLFLINVVRLNGRGEVELCS